MPARPCAVESAYIVSPDAGKTCEVDSSRRSGAIWVNCLRADAMFGLREAHIEYGDIEVERQFDERKRLAAALALWRLLMGQTASM